MFIKNFVFILLFRIIYLFRSSLTLYLARMCLGAASSHQYLCKVHHYHIQTLVEFMKRLLYVVLKFVTYFLNLTFFINILLPIENYDINF